MPRGGSIVLKPVDDPLQGEELAALVAGLDADRFRIARPVGAADGRFVVAGSRVRTNGAAGPESREGQPPVGYSYWSASRTLSREARRAGRAAARIPASTATAVKATSCMKGTWNEMP